MAMSRSYLEKKIHEIEVILQRLAEDLPAETSDRPDGASAPRRHARRVSAEVEHADRRRVTSAERLPSLTSAVERTSRTVAERTPPTAPGRTPPTAAGRTPPTAWPPAAAASMPIASPALRDTFKLPRYAGITALEPYLAQVGLAAANNQWNNQATAAHVALATRGEGAAGLARPYAHRATRLRKTGGCVGTTLWQTGFKGQHAGPADPPAPPRG